MCDGLNSLFNLFVSISEQQLCRIMYNIRTGLVVQYLQDENCINQTRKCESGGTVLATVTSRRNNGTVCREVRYKSGPCGKVPS